MPWTSPWPFDDVLKVERFLVKAISRRYFGFLAVVRNCKRCETSLDKIRWSRLCYFEATCWLALDECKQGDPELAPCPEAATALSVLSGGLLRLYTLSISLYLPFLVLRSRIAWLWCPFACACTAPGWVCAGRLICLTPSMSATLRGRLWWCNGDAQLVMGVAARAKPPPCNVERRSIPNSRDSRFSTPWTFLCLPSTVYCCAYIDVGGKLGALLCRGSSDDDGRRCVKTASWSEVSFCETMDV